MRTTLAIISLLAGLLLGLYVAHGLAETAQTYLSYLAVPSDPHQRGE